MRGSEKGRRGNGGGEEKEEEELKILPVEKCECAVNGSGERGTKETFPNFPVASLPRGTCDICKRFPSHQYYIPQLIHQCYITFYTSIEHHLLYICYINFHTLVQHHLLYINPTSIFYTDTDIAQGLEK